MPKRSPFTKDLSTPFLLVADLRTGSTLLATALNQHPQIRCRGELFHPEDLADNQFPGVTRQALSSRELIARALNSDDVHAVGFRAIISHPNVSEQPQWADAWDIFRTWAALRVIFLRRRDPLAQYASICIAQKTGYFHPEPQNSVLVPENRPKLHIDLEVLQQWIQERERLCALRRAQLEGKLSLEVKYEALTNDWSEQMQRIQNFLQVEPRPLAPVKRKQEQRPLSEVILNYEECRNEVAARPA